MAENPESVAVINSLFQAAEAKGGLDYIFTLVRITGITRRPDPLVALAACIEGANPLSSMTTTSIRVGLEELITLGINLVNCASQKSYDYHPFIHLRSGKWPTVIEPALSQMVKELLDACTSADQTGFKVQIETYVSPLVMELESATNPNLTLTPYLEGDGGRFLMAFLRAYREARLRFKDAQRYFKLQKFDVLELLKDEQGLFGFQIHYSNGSSSRFVRKSDSTEAVNFNLDRPLGFFVGDLNRMTSEWRVGEKKLYEIGLPGRYNALGEWKPLIYPAEGSVLDELQRRARSHSDDRQVQGALLYIMCTCHKVIEFVVKTDLDFADEQLMVGDRLHLWKCPPEEAFQNERLYDGTFRLDTCGPEAIKEAISILAVTLNRIAFAYGGHIKWRLKYNGIHTGCSLAQVTKEDLAVANTVFQNFPNGGDARVLDAAMDWYNHGTSARDVFARFLCYFRCVEVLANSIDRGDAVFGIGYMKEKGRKQEQKTEECIQRVHDELYKDDKIGFVRKAYAECVQGSGARHRRVLEHIFGKDHRFVLDMFEKSSDPPNSLTQIRSKKAHGNLTLLNKEDECLVLKRVAEIEEIAKDLLMRLANGLKPDDSVPVWSGHRSQGISAQDPRAWLISNKLSILPSDADWRIRSEWCDE